jgi:NAD(P)-dependent dehydrogenase (short-subunit alcohol dehydrogenase family)
MQLTDRHVAIVTGGASGLGAASARALHAAGANVVLFDLPQADGASLVAELGERARFIPTDVTDGEAITEAVAQAEELGEIRVAVNCAGVGWAARVIGKDGPHDLDLFRRIIEVNLVGTFNVLRVAAASMSRNEPVDGDRGVIINTASAAAFDGQVGQAGYSASKGGVVAMTLPIARDLAQHQIRIMVIAPGTFDTPMLAGLPEATRQSLAEDIPHPHRLGDPAEFGLLVRQFVEHPYLNGDVIRLDGALRMRAR